MTTARAAELLGEAGAIARRLPDYEARPQQLELANAVERALGNRRHLVAEAGTGTGKSFAYLVPAAVHADGHQGEGPIVVSTRTIALQEQLERKDLPFLHAVLPIEWSSVTAVGRNNYVCLRRRDLALHENGLFDEPDRRAQLERIVTWSANASDGTRFELDPPPPPDVWEEVQAEHGNCLHRACRHYDRCYWQRARRRMQTAQVLIVNHALYFADLALRIAGASYLPAHRVVIFDEAHHLERVATESLGLRLGSRSVQWHLRRLHNRRSHRSLLAQHGTPAARTLWEEAWQLADMFFDGLYDRLRGSGASKGGIALHDEVIEEPLSHVLARLAQEVATAAIASSEVELRMELQARANGLDALCGVIRTLCRPGATETPLVRWLEPARGGVQLCAAPLDVSQALRQHLFEGGATAVLLSATIGTGDDPEFGWFRRKLGIDDATALRLDSPFDYDRAVELVVEEAMPDPGREEPAFRREVAERTARHAIDNGGRALVLCTSWEFVRELAQRLRPELEYHGIELLVQGEAPLTRLLEKKREQPSTVLLGTDSLWEGIDVPGEALTLLVITRLPFQNPSHPLTQARLAALRQAGRDPFADHTLPEAILRFRQGFGRLIRNESDRGRVVILDPRVRTKAYGRRFLQALPFSHESDAH
ncbi:MAG: ATP-dependent DNA helicase [Planctomycetes bacterium]|nr:ATP-dependent DNA helicase [Planctomycetota bacterium]